MGRKSKRAHLSDDEDEDAGRRGSAAPSSRKYAEIVPEDLYAEYASVVREFTREMMGRKVVSRFSALFLLSQIIGRVASSPEKQKELESCTSFRDVVEAANNNLRSYSFAIKEVRTEGDGKLFYVYSNEKSDEMSKSIQCREPWLTAACQHIVTTVTSNGDGTIRRSALAHWLSGSRLDKPPTLVQLEDGIDRLIMAGWLVEPPGKPAYLTLGPRALVELRGVLPAVLPEENKCPVCKQFVVMGAKSDEAGEDGVSELKIKHPYCIEDETTHKTLAESDAGVKLTMDKLRGPGNARPWAKMQATAVVELARGWASTATSSAAFKPAHVREAEHGVSASFSSSSSGVGFKRRTSGGGGAGRGGRGRGSDTEDSGADEDSNSGTESEEEDGVKVKKEAKKEVTKARGKKAAAAGPARRGKPKARKDEDSDSDHDDADDAAAGGAGAASADADASAADADESQLSATQPRGGAAKASAAKRPRLRKAAQVEDSEGDD